MPEDVRRHAGGPALGALWASGLGLLLAVGCLNTDLPTVPANPPAPALTVATPRSGDIISLTQQVAVSAASVNGINNVSVLCGPLDGGARVVHTWTSPPYLGQLNFGVCQGVTETNPDGGSLPILDIEVRALSDAGATNEVDLVVSFNSVGPDLTVSYPPTAQPKSPFTVTVGSNIPLRSIPQVSLNLTPADSVTSAPNPDGGLPLYLAYFKSTPGLGTDNLPYTPGLPVPIEALTDTDETVRLVVSGTAQNGNTTELDLSVELTRVVWDRFIPGQPASSSPIQWAAEPLAYAGGLLLPLATSSPASSTSEWLPGLFLAPDGTFVGFNPALLDGGYVAEGINAQGQTLLVVFPGNFASLLLVPPPNLTTPPVRGTTAAELAPPLTRVDNLLCLQDSVTACSKETVESLVCLDASLKAVTATSGTASTGPPVPGVVAGAGGRYLSPVSPVCNSSWNLVDLGTGTVSFGPLADPNGVAECTVTGVTRMLPVGDGTFVVQLQETCGFAAPLPPEFPIVRVGVDSSILGAYTAPLGTPALVQQEVVGVLADGRVVTLTNAPPYANFQLWSLNSSTPDVTTPIAGLYNSADSVLNSVVARSSYTGADGSFAVLLSSDETFGAAVAAFGPNLQPLWLYLYTRIADATSTRLVSAPSVGDVYLVDEFNSHAVSLRVVPAGAVGPPDAGPPDAGGPSAEAGIYVAQRNAVLVFPLDANGDTAPIRTISGEATGLSQASAVAMDSQGNLYVANATGATVTVYAPLASGNVAPLRTLTAEGMGTPAALAVGVGDDVYVATCPNCSEENPGGDTAVFHFAAGASSNATELVGDNTLLTQPIGIALGAFVAGVGQPLYVTNDTNGQTLTFGPGATGDATPSATFTPNGATYSSGIAYASGTLFLGGIQQVEDGASGVLLFPANSTGTPNPTSTLQPPVETPSGVAVDVSVTPPVVYLLDSEVDSIYVMTTSGTPPNLGLQSVVTVTGDDTLLDEPAGILVVK
jgi:hypothetical protein